MSATFRLTASDACAACGAYGNTQHRPTCNPRRAVPIQLGLMRRARRNSRISAAVRNRLRLDQALLRGA